MRTRLALTIALTLLASLAHAQTLARPAKPQVTLGAEMKQLLFDWAPAAGATYYQMYVLYPGGSRFVPFGERMPASDTHLTLVIAVHLAHWSGSRWVTVGFNDVRLEHWVGAVYVLGACNSAGCTSSSLMDPKTVMPETAGYFKASNTEAGGDYSTEHFGFPVTLSKDGYTLAVGAPGEASNAIGVNGNQADNSSPWSGAVYLFRRRGNSWQQQAYIKPGVNLPGGNFGHAVALSADGSTLVAGGISSSDAGAAYVYRRFRNAWSLVQTLHSPTPVDNARFGHSVDISDDARTIKVNSRRSIDDVGIADVNTHIFLKEAGTWVHVTTLTPFYAGDRCTNSVLDGLGQTLVFSCLGGPTGGRIVTLKGAGRTWVHVDDLPTSFGTASQPVALNVDSSWMVLREGGVPSIAVSVYRWNGTEWVRAAGIPAVPSAAPAGLRWISDLAISDDGGVLAISDASALNAGDVLPYYERALGAVYVYRRGASPSAWTLRNVVKAPNPEYDDSFGASVSLSASGRTLAVGAPQEDSNARGIDGDRTDNSTRNAGAAYLY